MGLALLSLATGAAAPGSTITDLPTQSIINGADTHIDDQMAYVNRLIGPISYTLWTPNPMTATVTATGSSNLSLVPLSGITCGGSGTTRTVTISPTADVTGTSAITLTVLDTITDTVTFTVTVNDVPELRLPLILNSMYPGADLRVAELSAREFGSFARSAPNCVWVRIANYGTEPVTDEFWVDLYVDPTTAPTGVNQRWEDLCTYGAHWAITSARLPLEPGEYLYLISSTEDIANVGGVEDAAVTKGMDFVLATEANMPEVISPTLHIYAQVDSVNLDTDYGAVYESDEEFGRPYNNILSRSNAPASLNVVEGVFTVTEPGVFAHEPRRE
jgi:hypothetical protein